MGLEIKVEKERCKTFLKMPESMKKLICSQCNHYGRVKTEFGYGRCLRYENQEQKDL